MTHRLSRRSCNAARAAGLVAAAVASLGSAEARDWPSAPYRGQLSAQPPCSCRTSTGKPVEVGQEACIRTGAGGKRALCALVVNNTSWQVGPVGCEPDPDLTH